ncbi:MAG: restriction endonuclease subunit M [Lactobacillaceae bacterium]|jgi:hypothetical protein|nr:restriction endonuclease subunit M [Lactobacillaceae bacterium]
MKITELINLKSGSPQFRIKESILQESPIYKFYGQAELEEDLAGVQTYKRENKQIRTLDEVTTLKKGDLIFSLISGTASIVSNVHDNYLFTQNYVMLDIERGIDRNYLIYLLNENKTITHQFHDGLQGSMVLKYTVKQLRELIIPELPTLEKQQIIGNIYLKQLHLQAIRERMAKNETKLNLLKLSEKNKYE